MRHALVTVVLLGAAGCGGSGSVSTSSPAVTAPTSPVSAAPPAAVVVVTPAAAVPCAAGSSSVALPADWPTDLPLPPGLVLTRTEVRSGKRLIAYGRVPGDFHPVVTFFNRELPKAGYPQTEGQLDPNDAESDFGGKQISGRWKVGHDDTCPGQSGLVVLITR